MTSGAPVHLKLPGGKPGLTVEVLPRGLTVHRLIIHANGYANDIVIGPEKPEDHAAQKYTNTVIGRYSNRIPVGTHVLERNGFKSEFEPRANENPEVSLHGGTTGYDACMWEVLERDEILQLFSKGELERAYSFPEESYRFFRLISPDGDQGYPGELLTEVLITLIPAPDQGVAEKVGSLVIIYRSKLGGPKKTVTPVNLTQHWGFNLDASLGGGQLPEAASIMDHELTIRANEIAKLGELFLPTGKFISASSLPAYDFQQSRLIGTLLSGPGFNDYYHFVDSVVYPLPTRILLSEFLSLNALDRVLDSGSLNTLPCAQISSKKSGIKLEFFTNQRGVMFYSHYLASSTQGARKLIHGGSGVSGCGDSYGPWTAAFLEFHEPLAAFLQQENKDKEDTLLTSDELYNNFVRLEITSTTSQPRPGT